MAAPRELDRWVPLCCVCVLFVRVDVVFVVVKSNLNFVKVMYSQEST